MANMSEVKNFIHIASEEDIDAICHACQDELWTRKERARKRDNWASDMYLAFLAHPNAVNCHKGNMTIVALYERNSGVSIGVAKCSPTDTFSELVGVAVAYARATKRPVPDFI